MFMNWMMFVSVVLCLKVLLPKLCDIMKQGVNVVYWMVGKGFGKCLWRD